VNLYIDYGGTGFRYILEDGKKESSFELKSQDIDLVDFIEKQLKENSSIKSVSISFAGHVNDGEIIAAPNIDIKEFRIKEYFEQKFDISLYIENDLKAASLAEYRAKNEAASIAVLYIGTGFGSAYIDRGNIIRGCSNLAGEIGHMPYKEAPFRCGCGKNNCLELFCSGGGLKKWIDYYKIECSPTLKDLKNCANIHSAKVIENFYDALSYSVSTVTTLLNPEYMIMGGSVILKNPELLDFIRSAIEKNSMPYSAKKVHVEISALTNGSLEGSRCLKNQKK